MTDLPFLYHHGPTIWLIAIAGFAALVLATFWIARYLIARNQVRVTLRRVRRSHGAIRGVLRGGGATTVEVHSPNPRQSPLAAEPLPPSGLATWRAESLWLETADRKLVLDGELRVVAGTRASGARRELPRLPTSRRDAVKEQLPWATKDSIARAIALHVDAGDEVEVRGVVVSKAGQGETGHREADIVWTLRGEAGPLELAAISPVAARVPLGLLRSVLVIGLSLGAATLAQRSLGEGWQDECRAIRAEDVSADAPLELDNGHPCVLATSVPKDREWSVQYLHRLLEEHRYRDPASVARLDAVAREAQGCQERVPHLYYHQRYEAAIEEAKRCSMSWYQHESLVMLGRFEEAVAVPVHTREGGHPKLPVVSTLIAAGRWNDAAQAVRAEQISDEYPELKVYRGCVADWLGHLGGDRESTSRLRALAATDPVSADAKECAGVLSELEPARRSYWIAIGREGGGRSVNSILAAADGSLSHDPLGEPENILLRPEDGGERDAAALWLLPGGERSWQRAVTLRWRAVKQALDNDPAAALVTARDAVAKVGEIVARDDERHPFTYRSPTMLVPAIQLYTDTILDLPAPQAELAMYTHGRLHLRSTQPLEKLGTHDEQLDRALAAARAGDGKPLLDAIRRRFHTYWRDADLIAVMPHVKTAREAFRRELPFLPMNNYIYGEHVFRNAINAFARRELLEAVGAVEAAKTWDEVYRRFDRVFRDRQKLVALVLYRN